MKKELKKKEKIPIIFIGNNNIGKEGVDGLRKYLDDLFESFENKKEKNFKKFGQKFHKKKKQIKLSILILFKLI